MGTRTVAESDNTGNSVEGRGRGSRTSTTRRARCIAVGDTITTSRDFANFMSVMIGDIVSGRIDPRTANAACNAGGKLLRIVELEHKFGTKKAENDRTLVLNGSK